jgi:acyl dehydratase
VTTLKQCKYIDFPISSAAPVTVSTRDGHNRCVVCSNLNPESWQVVFEKTEDGAVIATFPANPKFQGYDNQLHGGIMASLMDAAMTHCLFYQDIAAVTGDLRVRFLHPVACHTTIEIRAWLFFSCPPLYHLKAEITLNGVVMAWADAKFMRREKNDES